jgi:alanyl-tRNA synthetase
MIKDVYPELNKNKEFIGEQLAREEKKYEVVLSSTDSKISGTATAIAYFATGEKSPYTLVNDMFKLRTEDGIPLQKIKEKYENIGIEITDNDIGMYNKKIQEHQELSRTASAGMFKGGMADNSEMVVKYHTTTHLLHAALRKVLGQEVEQKGSNLNSERLRFDFSYGQKMTPEQIKQVEDIINEKIKEKLDVKMEEMSLENAKKSGAIGLFAEKYGDKVKVYTIGDFSKEICGGPHVENISTLGHFKIIKEEAVSAGVRRIKAVLE